LRLLQEMDCSLAVVAAVEVAAAATVIRRLTAVKSTRLAQVVARERDTTGTPVDSAVTTSITADTQADPLRVRVQRALPAEAFRWALFRPVARVVVPVLLAETAVPIQALQLQKLRVAPAAVVVALALRVDRAEAVMAALQEQRGEPPVMRC